MVECINCGHAGEQHPLDEKPTPCVAGNCDCIQWLDDVVGDGPGIQPAPDLTPEWRAVLDAAMEGES